MFTKLKTQPETCEIFSSLLNFAFGVFFERVQQFPLQRIRNPCLSIHCRNDVIIQCRGPWPVLSTKKRSMQSSHADAFTDKSRDIQHSRSHAVNLPCLESIMSGIRTWFTIRHLGRLRESRIPRRPALKATQNTAPSPLALERHARFPSDVLGRHPALVCLHGHCAARIEPA